MKKNNNKGFTLVEVIAVVALMTIVLVFGFNTYNYIIKNSKEKSIEVSIENVKKAAELYSKENTDVTKWWGYYTEDKQYKFYCVTVQDLINNGYFGEKFINKNITSENNVNNNTLIKIVKDISNMTIIKTEISKSKSLEECNKNIQDELNKDPTTTNDSYIITYDLNYNNNNKIVDEVGKTNNNYTLKEKQSRTGFIFSGWYTARRGGTKVGDAGDVFVPTKDIILYAHWVSNPNFKGVKIRYNVNGGTLAEPYSNKISITEESLVKIDNTTVIHELAHGESLTSDGLLNPTYKSYLNLIKKGYSPKKGAEWCTKDGKKCYDQAKVYSSYDFCTNTNSSCDITLYVNWVEAKYKVTYRGIGGFIRVAGNSSNLMGSYSGLWNKKGNTHAINITDWHDLSGNNKIGKSNGITWGTDYAQFNGTSSYISLGKMNSSKQTIITTFSVDNPSSNPHIVGNWQNGGGGIYISDGKIAGSYYINESYQSVNSGVTATSGKIYTVALVTNGSAIAIYVDGESKKSKEVSGSIGEPSGNTEMIIGCNPSGSKCTEGYFKGKVYEIAVLSTALSASRVKESSLIEATYNNNYTNLTSPTRDGYEFSGWYTAASGGVKITKESKVSTANDHIIYARWTPNKYTISYNNNGGTGAPNSQTKTHDINITLSSTKPTRANYTFAGWNTKSDGTGTNYPSGGTFDKNENTTLYAKWNKNQVVINYDANGGKLASTHGDGYTIKNSIIYRNDTPVQTIINYGEKLTTSGLTNWNNSEYVNLTRTGYSINSNSVWCTKDKKKCYNQTTAYSASDFCDASKGGCTVTLYANWVANKYKVTYRGLGGFIRVAGNSSNLMGSYSGLWNRGTTHTTNPDVWYDLSGRMKWGHYSNITWGADHAAFNGSSSYVNLGTMNSNKQTIIVTFSISNASSNPVIVGNWENGGGGIYISGGKIAGQYYINGGYKTVSSGIAPASNTIYTVALTYDGSKVSIYVDGVKKNSLSASGTIGAPANSTEMFAGCNPSGSKCSSGYFKGNIYELAIISAALTESRVKESSILEVTYDSKYAGLPNPTRNGYDFAGWYTAASGGNQVTTSTTVSNTNNQILYARWNPYIPNGYYAIVPNKNKNFALDVKDVGITNETKVQLYTKGTGIAAVKAQTWHVINIGDGGLRIINKHSIKDLDLKGAKAEKENIIQIYKWNGSKAQRWYPKRVSTGVFTLSSGVDNNYVIDIQGGVFENNRKVQIFTSNSSEAQKFYFDKVSYNNSYTIKYDCNTGKGSVASQTIKWTEEVKLNKNKCEKKYYSFEGWALNDKGTGLIYEDEGTYSGLTHANNGTVTLYAKWKDVTNPTCTVTKSNTGTTSGVTTKVTCSDNGSGCDTGRNPTGDTGLKSSKTYTVYDKEGNKGTCNVNVTSEKQTKYRTRSCSTCGRCKSAGCKEYNYVKEEYLLSANYSECDANYRGYSGYHVKNGKCYGYRRVKGSCKTHYQSCSSCRCASWGSYGSWSSWSTSSCSNSNTKQCDSRTLYK